MINLRYKIRDIIKEITSYEGSLFTYAFAYSLILGIAPFLIITVVFLSHVIDVSIITEVVQKFIPEELIMPFIEYVTSSTPSDWFVIISLFALSIWLASRSVYSFLIWISVKEEVEVNRIKLRILAILYFVAIILLIVGMVMIAGFIKIFTQLALVIIFFLMIYLIYSLLTFKKIYFKGIIYGSSFVAVVLSILGRSFFTYIYNHTNYQTIYGPLASIMIMLISSYIISFIIYTGYAINASNSPPNQQRENKWIVRLLK